MCQSFVLSLMFNLWAACCLFSQWPCLERSLGEGCVQGRRSSPWIGARAGLGIETLSALLPRSEHSESSCSDVTAVRPAQLAASPGCGAGSWWAQHGSPHAYSPALPYFPPSFRFRPTFSLFCLMIRKRWNYLGTWWKLLGCGVSEILESPFPHKALTSYRFPENKT